MPLSLSDYAQVSSNNQSEPTQDDNTFTGAVAQGNLADYAAQHVAKPVGEAAKTALEYVGQKFDQLQPLGAPLRGLANAVQQGKNPLTGAWQGFSGQPVPSTAELIKKDPNFQSSMEKLPQLPGESYEDYTNRIEQTKNEASNVIGNLHDVLNPGYWGFGAGRLTQAGEDIAKGGKFLNATDLADNQATKTFVEATHSGQAPQFPASSSEVADLAAKNPQVMPTLDPSFLKNVAQGNKALLSVGNQPIIQGSSIAKLADFAYGKTGEAYDATLGKTDLGYKVKQGVQDLASGFKPLTSNPEFNQLAQENINKTNAAIIQRNNLTDYAKNMIQNVSGKHENTPEELNKAMLEYIEPRGSQTWKGQYENPPFKTQAKIAYTLPHDLKEYADQVINRGEERRALEVQKGMPNLGEKENYIEHQMTPEALDYAKKNDIELGKPSGGGEKSAKIANIQKRGVEGTINEINDKFANGKGHEIDELGNDPRWKGFTGKFFNDNVVDLDADRYLKSVKAVKNHDFMQAAEKAYGRTSNPQEKGWVRVPHSSLTNGEAWFPKEIGDYLNRSNDLMQNAHPFLKSTLGGIRATNNFVKKMNFGIYPGSAVKIELGNQQLAYLSGIHSPLSQLQGHTLAAHMRMGLDKLDDTKPFIYSKTLGALTEKQVYDLAVQNRGLGMGLFRGELESMAPKSQKLGPITGTGWKMHNYVEDGTRLGSYIEALKQGYSPAAAGNKVREALYDYSQRSPISQFASTYLPFPFLTFASKNAPAMLKKAFEEPGKFNLYEKVREMNNERDKDNKQKQQNLDQWEKDNLPVYIKSEGGKDYYLFGNRLVPQTDIDEFLGSGKDLSEIVANTPRKMMKYGLGMLNSFVKTPLELYNNRSYYFDNQNIQRMPGEKQAVVPGVNVDSKLAYAIRNNLRPVVETARLMQQGQPQWAKALHSGATLGLNVQAIDPEIKKLNAERAFVKSVKGTNTREGGEADVSYYARLKAIHERKGDFTASLLDGLNLETAKQNLQNIIKNRPSF